MEDLLTVRDVAARVGLSRMTIDRLERAGRFPRRRRVSARAVRWLASEIDTWINGRTLLRHAADIDGIDCPTCGGTGTLYTNAPTAPPPTPPPPPHAWFCTCQHAEGDHAVVPVVEDWYGDRDVGWAPVETYPCHVPGCTCRNYMNSPDEEDEL